MGGGTHAKAKQGQFDVFMVKEFGGDAKSSAQGCGGA
jgi:hypothetical protein